MVFSKKSRSLFSQGRRASAPVSEVPDEFMNVCERSKKAFDKFPEREPTDAPAPVQIPPTKLNHASMQLGWQDYDLDRGLEKGDTGAMFGDDFCLVHAITRVFVCDPENHIVALVSPMRYMMYKAYNMYAIEKPEGDIFSFASKAAAPRWAMRAAANQILAGQTGTMVRNGKALSITAVWMNKDGTPGVAQPVFHRVPYTAMSWFVMDKWLEQARSHSVSFVVADTRLSVEHNREETLPLCVRENESDLIMADVVTGIKDERYADCGSFSAEMYAFQFRGGWYAPKTQSGLTRIQRALYYDEDGKLKQKEAYSKKFEAKPSKELWFIGGIVDIDENANWREVGDHREFEGLNMEQKSGGLQNKM